MISSFRKAALLSSALVLAGCALTGLAHAQETITYAGGNGNPLIINLLNPVTYTITASGNANQAPVFLFVGAAPNNGFFDNTSTSNISYSINGVFQGTLDFARNGYNAPNGGEQTASDLELASVAALPGVSVGDTVTLSLGTLTTGGAVSDLPAGGTFSTYIADAFGNRLSANGIAGTAATAVPEPSEYAVGGMFGATLLFGMVRARRKKATVAA